MADISSTLRLWSATAASNSPAGGTAVGAGLDDNLRQIQAVVRQFLASQGANMASAATVDLSTADGFYVKVTGTTTITAFGTEGAGIPYLLEFTGALTLTHNGTSLILPGGANITTAAGDCAWMISEGSGNWRCALYTKASGSAIIGVVELIQSQTVSGVATVDFTSGISSTYDEYVVKFILAPATDATDLYVRLSQNGGTTFKAGTEYNHSRVLNTDGGGVTAAGGTGGSQFLLAASLGNAAAKRCTGHVYFYEPADTTHNKYCDWKASYSPNAATGTITQVSGGGNYTADTLAYNAIRFLMSSGNISGTFSLYGVRKT